jgi:ABC-type nitrate/sulfonate/bicarbonate transport system permease component
VAQLTEIGQAAPAGRAIATGRPPSFRPLFARLGGSDTVLRVGTFLGLIAIWEILSWFIRPILFPSPARAFNEFLAMVHDGRLADAWAETLFVLVTALALSSLLGVGMGILFGRYRMLSDFFAPPLTALFLVPKVALLPLIALWFGFGDTAKIVVVFLFSFFEVFFTVRNGVRTVDAEYIEVARSYSIPERQMLRKIIMPAILPYIATGLRLGLLHGMVGVVLVGFFLQNNGIGGLLYGEGQDFKIAGLFAGLATVALVGLAINSSLRWAERKVAPWRTGFSG